MKNNVFVICVFAFICFVTSIFPATFADMSPPEKLLFNPDSGELVPFPDWSDHEKMVDTLRTSIQSGDDSSVPSMLTKVINRTRNTKGYFDDYVYLTKARDIVGVLHANRIYTSNDVVRRQPPIVTCNRRYSPAL